jgi:hypothetical protein
VKPDPRAADPAADPDDPALHEPAGSAPPPPPASRRRLVAIVAVLLTLGTVLFVGSALYLLYVPQPAPHEGAHAVGWPVAKDDIALNGYDLALTTTNASGAVTKQAWALDPGVALHGNISFVGHPKDGSNGTIRVDYRVDQPQPVRLAYDANLSRTNTFRLAYERPCAGAPSSVARLVRPSGWLDALTLNTFDGEATGRFHVVGALACDATAAGAAPATTTLVGEWPAYRGPSDVEIWGGVAIVGIFVVGTIVLVVRARRAR